MSNTRSSPEYQHRTMRHLWLWMTSYFRQTEFMGSDENKPAIYFIHGTADWASSGTDIAESLTSSLFSKIHLVSFQDRLQGKDIESFSIQLAHKIKFENDKNVILIGHSRGGLVATHFAKNYAEKLGVTVHSVIAITTPYKGSRLARCPLTSISDSVKDYQKDSPFLTTLCKKPITTPHVFIAAENDWLVMEPDSYLSDTEDTAKRTIKSEDHLSVMHSGELQETIETTLSNLKTPELELKEEGGQESQSGENLLTTLSQMISGIDLSGIDDGKRIAIENLTEMARQSMPSQDNKADYRNWEFGVQLAIERIQKPNDELARKLLMFHATHFVPGHSVAWKKFLGALAILASITIALLILTHAPIIAGVSLTALCVNSSALLVCGAALFYHGRQKSLAHAYSQLATACSIAVIASEAKQPRLLRAD